MFSANFEHPQVLGRFYFASFYDAIPYSKTPHKFRGFQSCINRSFAPDWSWTLILGRGMLMCLFALLCKEDVKKDNRFWRHRCLDSLLKCYSRKAAWQSLPTFSLWQRNDKSHSADLSCPHRLKTAIRAPSRAVTTGNQSSVRTKKSLSSHSRNARKTVIWVPDEYLHQTGQKDRLCSS